MVKSSQGIGSEIVSLAKRANCDRPQKQASVKKTEAMRPPGGKGNNLSETPVKPIPGARFEIFQHQCDRGK